MSANSSRVFVILAFVLLVLALTCEARPFFSGLVSVDLAGLEQGYSSKGGKGCFVVNNALAEDLSEFPEEAENAFFRRCDWE